MTEEWTELKQRHQQNKRYITVCRRRTVAVQNVVVRREQHVHCVFCSPCRDRRSALAAARVFSVLYVWLLFFILFYGE